MTIRPIPNMEKAASGLVLTVATLAAPPATAGSVSAEARATVVTPSETMKGHISFTVDEETRAPGAFSIGFDGSVTQRGGAAGHIADAAPAGLEITSDESVTVQVAPARGPHKSVAVPIIVRIHCKGITRRADAARLHLPDKALPCPDAAVTATFSLPSGSAAGTYRANARLRPTLSPCTPVPSEGRPRRCKR